MTYAEAADIIKPQIHRGYPALIRDREYNARFLFVTGYASDGRLKAHEFVEGFEEKNCNMNPYEMEDADHWLKDGMELLLLRQNGIGKEKRDHQLPDENQGNYV